MKTVYYYIGFIFLLLSCAQSTTKEKPANAESSKGSLEYPVLLSQYWGFFEDFPPISRTAPSEYDALLPHYAFILDAMLAAVSVDGCEQKKETLTKIPDELVNTVVDELVRIDPNDKDMNAARRNIYQARRSRLEQVVGDCRELITYINIINASFYLVVDKKRMKNGSTEDNCDEDFPELEDQEFVNVPGQWDEAFFDSYDAGAIFTLLVNLYELFSEESCEGIHDIWYTDWLIISDASKRYEALGMSGREKIQEALQWHRNSLLKMIEEKYSACPETWNLGFSAINSLRAEIMMRFDAVTDDLFIAPALPDDQSPENLYPQLTALYKKMTDASASQSCADLTKTLKRITQHEVLQAQAEILLYNNEFQFFLEYLNDYISKTLVNIQNCSSAQEEYLKIFNTVSLGKHERLSDIPFLMQYTQAILKASDNPICALAKMELELIPEDLRKSAQKELASLKRTKPNYQGVDYINSARLIAKDNLKECYGKDNVRDYFEKIFEDLDSRTLDRSDLPKLMSVLSNIHSILLKTEKSCADGTEALSLLPEALVKSAVQELLMGKKSVRTFRIAIWILEKYYSMRALNDSVAKDCPAVQNAVKSALDRIFVRTP